VVSILIFLFFFFFCKTIFNLTLLIAEEKGDEIEVNNARSLPQCLYETDSAILKTHVSFCSNTSGRARKENAKASGQIFSLRYVRVGGITFLRSARSSA